MAISGHTIVAIMAFLLKVDIMASVNMAINMFNIGVYAKNRKNVDHHWKRFDTNFILREASQKKCRKAERVSC